jgi:hypothetical protein
MTRRLTSVVRATAAISVLLWAVALFLPAYIRFEADTNGQGWSEATHGWECLLFGWVGPLGIVEPAAFGHALPREFRRGLLPSGLQWVQQFACYANLFWAFNILRMADGAKPSLIAASIGAMLCLSALDPIYINFGDDHGIMTASAPEVGAYLWAVSICIPLLAAVVLSRRGRSPRPPAAAQRGPSLP